MKLEATAIFRRLRERLSTYDELIENSIPVLSFSGGKDSFLIYAFYRYLLETCQSPPPILFYMNHRIRNNPKEVEGILQFLKDSGWDFFMIGKNIPSLSKRLGKSMEETGRIFRYRYLQKIQTRRLHGKPSYIVTGHHTEDYMESVWIHFLRGGGKQALQTLPVWDGKILRPLLVLEDKELYELYSFIGQQVFEDESNTDRRYLRNRIRQDIIPFLKKEGMNFQKFYSQFHDDTTAICEKTLQPLWNKKRVLKYLVIPSTTLQKVSSALNWKRLLDIHLRLLEIHPSRKSTIETTFPWLWKEKPFSYQTNEFYLYIHPANGVFLARTDSALFRTPKFTFYPEIYEIEIHWADTKTKLNLTEISNELRIEIHSSDRFTVAPPYPGERINEFGIHKQISEKLRIRGIPPLIRRNFPILRKNNQPIKILFEIFDPFHIT